MTYLSLATYEIIRSNAPLDLQELVAINENISYAVSVLNKKGYTTIESCEGHYDTYIGDFEQMQFENGMFILPYISFANGIWLPSVPDNWCETYNFISTDINAPDYQISIVADVFSAESEGEFYKIKMAVLTDLINWVESLPENKK